MPELPEVETVKETLKRQILNKTITGCNIYYSNIIASPTPNKFKKLIVNNKINDIKRRGKWLIFDLDNYYLLSHLRMEGKYFYKDSNKELLKHEHIVFKLDDGKELRYHDTRKFGKMYLIKRNELNKCKPMLSLGLEPWDNNLNSKYLKDKYKNKKLPIKTVLLDQSIIAGIGNIYADEILFLSHINPHRKAYTITKKRM